MIKLLFLLSLITLTCFADVDIDVDFDFDVQDQEIKIKSKFENDTHEDKLEYRIYGQDHPHIEAKLTSEVNDVEKQFEFEIEFKKLFEYNPRTSADLSYSEFKDEIINELEDFDIVKIEDLTPNSNSTKKFRMAGKNNYIAATIMIKIADPAAIKFNPKDVKIDISFNFTELRAMGWLKNNSHKIGLKVKVKTEVEVDDERDDDVIKTNPQPDISETVHLPLPNSNAGFFTWVNYLECNNGSLKVNVIASKLEIDTDDDEIERSYKVFFSFVPGTTSGAGSDYINKNICVWDPVMGYETYTSTNSVAQVIGSLLLVALALFI